MDRSSKVAARETVWSLEVVRGRQAGTVYRLRPGETVIGNALDGQPGVDLKDQEGSSPRRMAGRHAAIVSTGGELVIRDLESPGGTFVNRQRLLAGQSRRLEAGDLIQLASVQLAVKPVKAELAASPTRAVAPSPAPPARPAAPPVSAGVSQGAPSSGPGGHPRTPASPRLAIPFTLSGGPVCRSWDDFLVLAAQNWQALCDELTSGRLSDYIRKAQRPDLLPRLEKARSADDQLDDWLGRLPTTKPSGPELDVHPQSLFVQAVAGGGLTRQTLRMTNIGYRLLRSTARVEPAGAHWLRLPAEFNGGSFATIDQTDLTVELDVPETLVVPLEASILIESNGGTRRVPVRIERAEVPPESPDAAVPEGFQRSLSQMALGEKFAETRPGVRVLVGAGGAILLRLIVLIVGLVLHGAADVRLSSVAFSLVGAGAAAATWLALRRGDQRDAPAAALAGGLLGLLASALGFAVIQSVEHFLGAWSTRFWAVGLLWGTMGALAALASNYLIPHRPAASEVAR
jgi:FHA domain